MNSITHTRYTTHGGVAITVQRQRCDGSIEMDRRLSLLDSRRGMLLSSGVEYPNRYRRHQLLFLDPPIAITVRGRAVTLAALNARGEILLHECLRALQRGLKEELHQGQAPHWEVTDMTAERIEVAIAESDAFFAEEARTRQPSVFSVLRVLIMHFGSEDNSLLGLYGAFGYDLAFQFETIRRRLVRDPSHRDLVLYLPDEILTVSSDTGEASIHRFEFVCRDANNNIHTTGGLKRRGSAQPPVITDVSETLCDHEPGEYAAVVNKARECFKRGELFETVPGQMFSLPCQQTPSVLFEKLAASNPAPYAALANLGEQEYLIAASPEMFVRVRPDTLAGDLVETCPISGTIARGADALEDADRIRELMNSDKDEAELSMCTDVDRNDKNRVCVPGSVEIIGRRQVELYSRLIHTVDHVQGRLLPGRDALDAFLSHAWAVTVTGAPKQRAMQFIEDHEKSVRRWYGGAFGRLAFDGSMDTGLTIRTVQIADGIARVRAGATLLQDSDPQAEELETRLKASALLSVLKPEDAAGALHYLPGCDSRRPGTGLRALMVDHQDSFVHSLAACFRAAGMNLETLRPEAARAAMAENQYDLVILSPGPGRPADFDCQATLVLCERLQMPVFGVCLGLQAMVEYAGGELSLLPRPVHGRASKICVGGNAGESLFRGLVSPFSAGRYHSIVASRVPSCYRVIARSEDDNAVMAIEHEHLPWTAVQFHPESLLTLGHQMGQQLVNNVVTASAIYQRLAATQQVGRYHR